MRVCFYVISHDTGFAPNPFGGFCTLAACTPNHQGLRLARGHWLVGNSTVVTGRRIVYAMRISDVLDFDEYYRNPRFTEKKAHSGSWQTQCGDNIHFRDDTGRWTQALAFYHTRRSGEGHPLPARVHLRSLLLLRRKRSRCSF
jgi:hypothetical protein